MNRFKILIFVSCFLFLVSFPAFAQTPAPTEYKLLAPIPQLVKPGTASTTDTATYIPGLFKLAIALAGALAVIRLIYAGIKYMSTDAFTEKNEAKGIITQTLWGLLFAMSAWLIVATIFDNDTGVLTFNLTIERQAIRGDLGGGSVPGLPENCPGCVSLSVPQRSGSSCATPRNCQVTVELDRKLDTLNQKFPLVVTESYPPTYVHQSSCHRAGTCVDVRAVISSRVYDFIVAAGQSGLKAVYEVESETKKNTIIQDSCGTSNQNCRTTLGRCIAVLPPRSDGSSQITSEHFSIYNQSPCT